MLSDDSALSRLAVTTLSFKFFVDEFWSLLGEATLLPLFVTFCFNSMEAT